MCMHVVGRRVPQYADTRFWGTSSLLPPCESQRSKLRPQVSSKRCYPLSHLASPMMVLNSAVELGLVVYSCNPTTWQTGAGELL